MNWWHFICYIWQRFSCSPVEWLVVCAPPWWAVGAFQAGSASCSSLYPTPHACRKSVNGVWVILNFHEHNKEMGGGWLCYGKGKRLTTKDSSRLELYVLGQFSTLLSSSGKGHSWKDGCFFLFGFEAAWRLRIACLKVTQFLLKREAAPCFGDSAVYGGCCCARQTVQCESWRHCINGLVNGFLTNELLWKSQVTMENASSDLLIQCLSPIHLPWAWYCAGIGQGYWMV